MSTIKLDKKAVEQLFEDNNHQVDVLIGIYKMIFPQWGHIASVEGWPRINRSTWLAISRLFMWFDQKYHSNVVSGGLWLNHGFSCQGEPVLADWYVDVGAVTIKW